MITKQKIDALRDTAAVAQIVLRAAEYEADAARLRWDGAAHEARAAREAARLARRAFLEACDAVIGGNHG